MAATSQVCQNCGTTLTEQLAPQSNNLLTGTAVCPNCGAAVDLRPAETPDEPD